LRFIPLPLRRTLGTPRTAGLARLELGALGAAVNRVSGPVRTLWERHLAAMIEE
jgi:hypothetical protein